jgi:hypothetical protein
VEIISLFSELPAREWITIDSTAARLMAADTVRADGRKQGAMTCPSLRRHLYLLVCDGQAWPGDRRGKVPGNVTRRGFSLASDDSLGGPGSQVKVGNHWATSCAGDSPSLQLRFSDACPHRILARSWEGGDGAVQLAVVRWWFGQALDERTCEGSAQKPYSLKEEAVVIGHFGGPQHALAV